MDKRLEKYLQTVESELEGLREQQRESELREMRQHLEAIVARLREGGASEDEAVEAAIGQFGAARRVGRELQQADEEREPWWRVVLAQVCGLACLRALMYPLSAVISYVHGPSPLDLDLPSTARVLALGLALWWLAIFSSSVVASYISPRWAGRILICLMGARIVMFALPMLPLDMSWHSMLATLSWRLAEGICILAGSYLGSRLAQKRRNTRTFSPTEVA